MLFVRRFPLSCIFVLAAACSDAQSSGPSRAAVVSDLVREVMLPSQHALASSTAMLPAALDLCAAPTADAIAGAQQRWHDDARAFTATEAFGYGPAMEQHLDAQIWFWPTRPDTVDEIVAGTASIDATFVDGLGTASKGLPAIEAQLFDPEVLARFDPADPAGTRRCALVHELALDAAEQAAALEFCTAPTADAIAGAQQRWRGDASTWCATEAFGYGPAMEQHLDAQIWFWPTRPETVDDIVADTATIDAALVDGLGTASKGLPAIEAQLFDSDVLARFDPADPAGVRRCALVHELALDVAEQAAALEQAWAEDGDDFGGLLSRPGGDNPSYPDEQSALDELVNGIIVVLQIVDDTKLGKPLGVKTGGTPLPELVEAPYSDASLDTIAADLATVRALYLGADGLALDDLIIARSPMLDETINQQLDDADAAIAAVPPPLRTAITEHPFEVQLAIDAVKALRRSFSADLAQQLGITVTLSDNDGD
ncbi:MAG: hypothetical protein IAG13_38750 [Deltaproteobacteria bacterium]|nr:hypothetical protein [Nannocystaceae bacterium]